MLIDTTQEGVVRVTIDFFVPLTDELEYKLDYILDSIVELQVKVMLEEIHILLAVLMVLVAVAELVLLAQTELQDLLVMVELV